MSLRCFVSFVFHRGMDSVEQDNESRKNEQSGKQCVQQCYGYQQSEVLYWHIAGESESQSPEITETVVNMIGFPV